MTERGQVDTQRKSPACAEQCQDGALLESPAAGVDLPVRKLDTLLVESQRVYVDWLNPDSSARYSDLDLRLMEPFHD